MLIYKMRQGSIVRHREEGYLLLVTKVEDDGEGRRWFLQVLGEFPKGGYSSMFGYPTDEEWLETIEKHLNERYELIVS